jgi:hypothetical protein
MRKVTQNRFLRFEDRIQHLVEGGFARLFAGYLHPREVAIQLARAMEDRAQPSQDGQHQIAPDVYIVRLNPRDHAALLAAHPDLATALVDELVEMARIGGYSFTETPEVRLLADNGVQTHQVVVRAQYARPAMETGVMKVVNEDTLSQPVPKAILIVNGKTHIPIERPILNLGRHRDNDVILEDVRVSRHHAQIRLRFGKYVLFDLGSSAGTLVNGHPIQEAVLQSGDIIMLAGNSLIYIEEEPNTSGHHEEGAITKPYVPLDAPAEQDPAED